MSILVALEFVGIIGGLSPPEPRSIGGRVWGREHDPYCGGVEGEEEYLRSAVAFTFTLLFALIKILKCF